MKDLRRDLFEMWCIFLRCEAKLIRFSVRWLGGGCGQKFAVGAILNFMICQKQTKSIFRASMNDS
jgi:hypothetical protein